MKPWLILVAALLPYSFQALAQEQGDVSRGKDYAAQVCAECHAIGAGDGLSPNIAAAPFKEIAARPEMTAIAISVWLQSEHENMPHIVPKAEELNDLIAYMMSLKN